MKTSSKHVKLFYVVNLIMLASVIFMGHSALGATLVEIGSLDFSPRSSAS